MEASRRTGNRAREKQRVFFLNCVFATAKLSFPKAKFGQILAREFEQIRISCGFRTYFIGACQHFFPLLLRAGASKLKWFFAGVGHADSHISVQQKSTFLHRAPFRHSPGRCNTTTPLCSVTFYREATSRNVNMPPPAQPYMTCESASWEIHYP